MGCPSIAVMRDRWIQPFSQQAQRNRAFSETGNKSREWIIEVITHLSSRSGQNHFRARIISHLLLTFYLNAKAHVSTVYQDLLSTQGETTPPRPSRQALQH